MQKGREDCTTFLSFPGGDGGHDRLGFVLYIRFNEVTSKSLEFAFQSWITAIQHQWWIIKHLA